MQYFCTKIFCTNTLIHPYAYALSLDPPPYARTCTYITHIRPDPALTKCHKTTDKMSIFTDKMSAPDLLHK